MQINWTKFSVVFTSLVLLMIAIVLCTLFLTEQRKYVINGLPKDDAIYALLTDEVLDELFDSQRTIFSNENILAMADAIMDAKAGKPVNPHIQVGSWEKQLYSFGTVFQKGDIKILMDYGYALPTLEVSYGEQGVAIMSLVCTEHPRKVGQYVCSTSLIDITDLAIRKKHFTTLLNHIRELVADVKTAEDAAKRLLVEMPQTFEAVVEKASAEKTK